MTTSLYIVEIEEPGRQPRAYLAKPSAAMRLVRRLISLGIPHAHSAMDVPLASNIEIEDMIDDLEIRYRRIPMQEN